MEDIKTSIPHPPPFVDSPPPYEEVATSPIPYELGSVSSTLSLPTTNTQTRQSQSHLVAFSNTFPAIAIPQTSAPSNDAFFPPFTRAYAPQLASAISLSEFLHFIDTLNSLFVAAAGLQIASHIGNGIAHLPIPIIPLAGHGISFGASAGANSTSFKRAEKYIQEMNESLFGPRGLKVELLKTPGLMHYIGLEGSTLNLPPLSGTVNDKDDVRVRRMRALKGKTAVLQYDGLPAVEASEGWWDRMGSKEAKRREEKRLLGLMEARGMGRGSMSRRDDRDMRRAEVKEFEMAQKLYWIVIDRKQPVV